MEWMHEGWDGTSCDDDSYDDGSYDDFDERLETAKARSLGPNYLDSKKFVPWEPKVVTSTLPPPVAPAPYSGESPLQPIIEPITPAEADEPTIRAREAVIASGYFPGAEQVIRAGRLDHIHCLQVALQLHRSLPIPVDHLRRQQAVVQIVRAVQRAETILPSPWTRLLRWCSNVQRQIMHTMMRHKRLRDQVVYANVVAANLKHKLQLAQQEIDARNQGTWIDGKKSTMGRLHTTADYRTTQWTADYRTTQWVKCLKCGERYPLGATHWCQSMIDIEIGTTKAKLRAKGGTSSA